MRRIRSFIDRTVGMWWGRLLGAVSDGTLADQEAMYASHRTTRDYICNAIGTMAWGAVFPVLTIVATQLVGAEQAGMFSMAFIVGLLLMFMGNYGVRTYQVSDLDEAQSFSDYQVNRVLTCVVMMVVGVAYCSVRGYDGYMFTICVGVFIYKMIDALADVYEGRLQQMDKCYLAGISQAFRSVVVIIVFSVVLLVTRNLAVASVAMGVVAVFTLLLLTLPLALFETPRSRKWTPDGVLELLKQCFPLFVALFLFNLIENMPKFVMEGTLSYDNQLYFNALYFPAQAILLTVGVIYKPLLVKLAEIWANPAKRKRFDIAVIAMFFIILALTGAMIAFMAWAGIPLLSLMYGLDFEPFRGLSYVMLVAGGVTAAIDFLYQAVTVLRRQGDVTKLYLITFGFSLFVPMLLIGFTGLPGAVLGYLIVMCILLALLVMEYIGIRLDFARGDKPFEPAPAAPTREQRRAARTRGIQDSMSFEKIGPATGKKAAGAHGAAEVGNATTRRRLIGAGGPEAGQRAIAAKGGSSDRKRIPPDITAPRASIRSASPSLDAIVGFESDPAAWRHQGAGAAHQAARGAAYAAGQTPGQAHGRQDAPSSAGQRGARSAQPAAGRGSVQGGAHSAAQPALEHGAVQGGVRSASSAAGRVSVRETRPAQPAAGRGSVHAGVQGPVSAPQATPAASGMRRLTDAPEASPRVRAKQAAEMEELRRAQRAAFEKERADRERKAKEREGMVARAKARREQEQELERYRLDTRGLEGRRGDARPQKPTRTTRRKPGK